MGNEIVEDPNLEIKQFFIEEEKFELLKQYREKVFKATQVSPALRKLANAVITSENLEKVASAMIDSLNKIGG